MSSGSNQGYLSSGVYLFVSSTGSSVQVVIHGISAGWISLSYANGDGLNVAGVTSVMKVLIYGKVFQIIYLY